MAITLDQATKLITVDPETSVTIQQLINAIRDWEDELVNMDCSQVASAGGKDDLGGGTLVGITLKLLNWKVKFADKGSVTVCTVSGGNLVAVDEYGDTMDAIEPSTNVTVMVAQSSSAVQIVAEAEWTPEEKEELPSKLWEYSARQLTSRDIVSGLPGEHLPSEEQVLDIKKRGDEAWVTGKGARGFTL